MRRIGRWISLQLATHFHRLTVLSPYPLPADSPAILVCNHTSFADPLFLQAACPRLIAWMIAREYAEMPGVSWLCRQIGTISVDRSGRDLAAARAALRALEAGRVLGVFPEGHLEKQRQLLPFEDGVSLLAVKSCVPIVPAWIDGTHRHTSSIPSAYLRPHEVVLRFGEPLIFNHSGRGADLPVITQRIADAIRALGRWT